MDEQQEKDLIETIKEQHAKDRNDQANNIGAVVISLIAIFFAGKFLGWW